MLAWRWGWAQRLLENLERKAGRIALVRFDSWRWC